MKHDNFTTWCLVATARIRFRPDRQVVYDELHAHLEDHRDALIEKGMDENEATQKALESMGSATQIAPQLAAIHKPFLGYLEIITRYAAIYMALALLLSCWWYVSNWGLPWKNSNDYDTFDTYAQSGVTVARELTPDTVTQSTLRSYSVPKAVIYDCGTDDSIWHQAVLRLEVDGAAPWDDDPIEPFYFHAVDSLGNYYYSDYESFLSDDLNISVYPVENDSLTIRTYDVVFHWFVSNEAEWLELRYDRDGQQLALRIDLTGGNADES